MRKRFVLVAALAAAGVGFAETFTWTGAEDAYWTNAANWSVGGATATRCPGVVSNANVASMWAGWTNNIDVASFSQTSARTTIDLDGLFAIREIRVSGATTPAYTLGNGDQVLPMRASGTVSVAADVVNMPVLPQRVSIGIGCYKTDNDGQADQYAVFRNDAVGRTLALHDFGYQSKNPDQGKYRVCGIRFEGAGVITVDGGRKGMDASYLDFRNAMTGTLEMRSDCGEFRCVQLLNGSHLTLGPDVVFRFVNGYNYFYVFGGVKVNGEGTMDFTNVQGVTTQQKSPIPEFACHVAFEPTAKYPYLLVNGYATGNVYPILFSNPSNPGFNAPVRFNARPDNMRLDVVRFGLRGEAGSLGDNEDLAVFTTNSVAAGGTLAYVGPGETTDRTIHFAPVDSSKASGGVLMQSGTGVWTLRSPIRAEAASVQLTLAGDSDSEGVFDAVVSNGFFNGKSVALELYKKGTGTWRLTRPNTFTGSTVVQGGTLIVGENASLEKSWQIVFREGNATLRFERAADAPLTINAMQQHYGTGNRLEITGTGDVEIKTFSNASSGTLDFIPVDDARIRLPAGTSTDTLRYKGMPARIDGDGYLVPVVDATVAARGDVIGDTEGTLGVVNAGTGGPDTLAADAVSVDSLVKLAKTPMTLAMGTGQKLAVADVKVASGAGDLALGDVAGQGALAPSGDVRLENDEPTAKLSVLAAFEPGGQTSVTGAGTVEFSGGAAGPLDLEVKDGNVRFTGAAGYALGDLNIGPKGGKKEATVTIADTAIVQGRAPTLVGNFSDGVSRLVITNATWVNTLPSGQGCSGETAVDTNFIIRVGHRSDGILEVQDGAVISNRLAAGGSFENYSSSRDAMIRQTGGLVVPDGNDYRGTYLGFTQSCVCYNLLGGTLRPFDSFGIGGYSYGYFLQEGGTLCCSNKTLTGATAFYVQQGNGYVGVYRITGGRMSAGTLYLTATYSDTVGSGKSAFVTDGATAEVQVGHVRGCENKGVAGVHDANLVLCAGVMKASGFSLVKPDGSLRVSFNGGQLSPRENDKDFFHYSSTLSAVREVVVQDAGATFDTAGVTGTRFTVPLTGATGGGVSGVTGFTPIANRIIPPVVWITGDGQGAVAVAEFDYATRTVTGVKIVNPGHGYTQATVDLYDRGTNRKLSYAATIAENGNTGSFTKRGAGDITFLAENTYGGKTILEGGTLVLGVPNALPATTTIVPRGGMLEATADNFPAALTVDVSELDPEARAVRFARVTEGELAAPPTVTIVGGEPGQDWHVTSAGGVFKVGVRKGTLLIVK